MAPSRSCARKKEESSWQFLELFGEIFGVEQLVVYIDISAARETLVRGRTDSTIANTKPRNAWT